MLMNQDTSVAEKVLNLVKSVKEVQVKTLKATITGIDSEEEKIQHTAEQGVQGLGECGR